MQYLLTEEELEQAGQPDLVYREKVLDSVKTYELELQEWVNSFCIWVSNNPHMTYGSVNLYRQNNPKPTLNIPKPNEQPIGPNKEA